MTWWLQTSHSSLKELNMKQLLTIGFIIDYWITLYLFLMIIYIYTTKQLIKQYEQFN